MGFSDIIDKLKEVAGKVKETAEKVKEALESKIPEQVKDLKECYDTLSAVKVVIATTVTDAKSLNSLEDWTNLFSNFDKNWDKFAKEMNETWAKLSKDKQENILETFARAHFGDKVFEAGSIVKNESANILGGIVGFKSGLDAFKGSYKDPVTALNKIKTGVDAIVKSTGQLAQSANNVYVFAQKLIGKENPQASALLGKLTSLPENRLVNGAMSALNIGSASINSFNSIKDTWNALKNGDFKGALDSGKAAVKNVKTIINEIKNIKKGKPAGNSPDAYTPKDSAKSAEEDEDEEEPEDEEDEEEEDNNDDMQASTNSYVCSGAKIKCTFGDKISKLTVLPDRTIWLTGQPMANISDHKFVNIAPFGKCHTTTYPPTGAATAANHGKLTPMPCVPEVPFPWMGGKNDVLLKGDPALLKTSSCRCRHGGTITITDNGQVDGTYREINKEPAAKFQSTEKKDDETLDNLDEEIDTDLTGEDILDGIQMALDVAGMIPLVGAAPDLINAGISACRGNWDDAALSLLAAVPGVGDVAGAGKIVKNGVKIASKTKKAKALDKTAVTVTRKLDKTSKSVNKTTAKAEQMGKMSQQAGKDTANSRKFQNASNEISRDELRQARARQMGVEPGSGRSEVLYDKAAPEKPANNGFLDLTRRDRFEIEESKAMDVVRNEVNGTTPKARPQSFNPFEQVKTETPSVKNVSNDGLLTPEQAQAIKDRELTKVNIKIIPPNNIPKGNPIVGKNLNIKI